MEKDHLIRFAMIGPAALDFVWPQVCDYLGAALAFSQQNEWSTEQLRERIASEEFVMAVAFEGRRILGAVVFDMGTNPGGERYVCIVCCGGERMDSWLEGMLSTGRRIARAAGATRLVMMGRPGWARILKGYGIEVRAIVGSVAVDDLRVPEGAEHQTRGA
ncbi:MAG: hypothetical protein ACRC1H_13075 [Caldilineaceae bacterium]